MYAKQLFGDAVRVSSSGVFAAKYPVDLIGPWAQKIIDFAGLDTSLSPVRTQTTQALLDSADLVVFMNTTVLKKAQRHFAVNTDKSLVWHVRDREEWFDFISKDPAQARPTRAYRQRLTWNMIKRRVDALHASIMRTGWVDVVDQDNQLRGYRLPLELVNARPTLWHRGCHAIITTPHGQALIQKRSANIVTSPNGLDVSVGGVVDYGEQPEAAMIREIQEELGLTVKKADLRNVGTYAWRHRTSCSHIASYQINVNLTPEQLVIDTQEVAWAKLISMAKLRKLVRSGRLRGYGSLAHGKRYYRWLVATLSD